MKIFILCFQVADKIFASRIRLHSLLFINSTVQGQLELVEEAKAVAKKFKGKVRAGICLYADIYRFALESGNWTTLSRQRNKPTT